MLHEEGKFPERAIYWHFPHHQKEGVSMEADILKGKWKLIYEFETEKKHLYNLEEDLGEEDNLFQDYPEIGKSLLVELEESQKKVGAEMPQTNENY
ncbi:hypothetical protein [Ancylomarina sp. 16SWW S1-10-2]|uniref:hypothetical protein n=1 Tax=Ancylomarina sp. 16SWW S1-10-2 TaxID=2499681 RepID=UPI0012AD86A2|nr:hypothetical protein [Ancylomarina sp. 16SWW S1-10-2]MRT93785.1 hypothetical protein [Ancylomarina sp. 16SWW S1-10-2]